MKGGDAIIFGRELTKLDGDDCRSQVFGVHRKCRGNKNGEQDVPRNQRKKRNRSSRNWKCRLIPSPSARPGR